MSSASSKVRSEAPLARGKLSTDSAYGMTIPLDFDIKPYAKLAALGALAVSGGAFALWLLTIYVSRPVPGGGIDGTHFVLSAIIVGMICAAVIAAHVVYALQLFRYSKEAPPK